MTYWLCVYFLNLYVKNQKLFSNLCKSAIHLLNEGQNIKHRVGIVGKRGSVCAPAVPLLTHLLVGDLEKAADDSSNETIVT